MMQSLSQSMKKSIQFLLSEFIMLNNEQNEQEYDVTKVDSIDDAEYIKI
jgi:hypothetical protein